MAKIAASSSLPLPGEAPHAPPHAPTSLGGEPSPRKTRLEHLRPRESGPALVVTIVGANFKDEGRYSLTLRACGSQHHTALSDTRCYESPIGETFTFPLGDDDAELQLKISAMRVSGLPQLSPRGVMANLDTSVGWDEEVGTTTLTLAQLLSMPHPAGGGAKHHEVQLFTSLRPRSALAGVVLLKWSMEDRVAEAHEAAQRATELLKQRLTSAAAERQGAFSHGRRRGRARPSPLDIPNSGAATSGGAEEDGAWAEREAARQADAADFDKTMLLAKWKDVLTNYQLVLWLPEGSSPPFVNMSAKQAVGLSDLAARHRSGQVAFTHAGMRITLSKELACRLRTVVEEKLALQPRQLELDCKNHIDVLMAADDGGVVSVSQRGATAAAAESRPRDDAHAAAAEPRHLTAQPSTRPRQPPHPLSSKWLEAAAMPFRPTSPRVAPSPRVAALMRANSPTAATPPPASRQGVFDAVLPTPPARIAPPAARSPRRSPSLDISD